MRGCTGEEAYALRRPIAEVAKRAVGAVPEDAGVRNTLGVALYRTIRRRRRSWFAPPQRLAGYSAWFFDPPTPSAFAASAWKRFSSGSSGRFSFIQATALSNHSRASL